MAGTVYATLEAKKPVSGARVLDAHGVERTEGAERADAREARAPARMAPLRGADIPVFAT